MPNYKRFIRSDILSSYFIPTLIVFLMIMVLVGFSWRTAARTVASTEHEQVEVRARYAEANILQRLSLYDTALLGAAGFIANSTDVTREEWKGYVASLDLETNFSAMLGFGYAQIVTSEQKAAYEASIQKLGFPNYRIEPANPVRDIYMPITYIEPLSSRNKNTFGRDMYSEESRRQAMDMARDTNDTTMTNVTTLRQDDNSFKNGVTIFFPIYRRGAAISTVEERRAAIIGFVYAPLSSEKLFGNIFDEQNTDFNFQVYDGDEPTAESLLYEQFPTDQGESYRWIGSSTIDIDTQTWNIRYGIRNNIVAESIRERPRSSAIGGTIFAFTVSLVVYLLLQRRNRLLRDKQERRLQHAKDNLLSLASHQLRTPATGVKQYVGMILEGFTGKVTHEQQTMLRRAYESNERQLRIINEFLYLAKADADRIVISPQRFDIVELTKQIMTDMKSEVAEAGHKTKLTHRAKSLYVYADIHSVRMIIENLISNAIKYTPPKGRIVITLKKSGHKVFVAVSDNGVGVKEADLPLLFQQFSRIPNKLTKSTSGSGIGLYLAKHLAKLNGGDITVASEEDRGSTFTAYLPTRNVKKITVLKRNKKVK